MNTLQLAYSALNVWTSCDLSLLVVMSHKLAASSALITVARSKMHCVLSVQPGT